MMSVEELQTLLIISRISRRATMGETPFSCCPPDASEYLQTFPRLFFKNFMSNTIVLFPAMWNINVLTRCLNFIIGLVRECLTETEW